MLGDTEDEYRRLLYVAMTRAADRLIIAGIKPGNVNTIRKFCWYDLADKGLAVVLIPHNMNDVFAVSDRIAVMHEGAIFGVLDHDRFSEENVLRLAVGKSIHPAGIA